MQTYVGKQNWEKFLAIDFHISVAQCERKYTAFASKLLQTQMKSIILNHCNLQQKAFYRLWLFDWYHEIRFQELSAIAVKKCEIRDFMTEGLAQERCLRKSFEWPAQYFSNSSFPPILEEIQPEIEDRFHV